ncbi:MAG: glycosyltransferase family 4 protein [Candidatus Thorarchaeota archaeon]
MRIGILHGWMLSGSGSNIYVQNVARTLWEQGHEVHLFCQDRDTARFPFVSAIRIHNSDGSIEETVLRPDGVVVHVPDIGPVLPVLVWDRYPYFEEVIEFPKMSFGALQNYLDSNTDAITTSVREDELDILHANHAIMMPAIAREVSKRTGIPYLTALHGSALVYAVKDDPTCFEQAVNGLEGASAVLVGNEYFKSQVMEMFAERYPDLSGRIVEVPLGVDTSIFKPTPRNECAKVIASSLIDNSEQLLGRDAEQSRTIRQTFYEWIRKGEVSQSVFEFAKQYSQKHPDADLQHRIASIDWEKPVVMFVGRLIPGKGAHDLLIAYYELARRVQCQLIVVGAGPMREWLEAFAMFRRFGIGSMLEPWLDAAKKLPGAESLLSAAVEWAEENANSCEPMPDTKVLFTGFLDHTLLQYLLPCADVAVFPSLVPESFGLVTLEAASVGVIPLVTDFSGLRDSALVFEQSIAELAENDLRFPLEAQNRIQTIAHKIEHALTLSKSSALGESLRATCERVYSWQAVTASLAEVYESIIK